MTKIKVRKFFIILLLSIFIYAYLDGSVFAYSLFYSCFLSIIISLMYLIYIKTKIGVDIRFNKDKLYTKELCEFTIVIKNYSILPIPYIKVVNEGLYNSRSGFRSDVSMIFADKNKRLGGNLYFDVRGIYSFKNSQVIIKDFLYIFTMSFIIKGNKTVTVYPKVYPLVPKAFNGYDEISTINSNKINIEDESSVRDIRKYRVGDSLRSIHWKLSAKYGELYVKNFDYASGERCSILLNMNKLNIVENHVVEEKTIELCVSLIYYLQNRSMKTQVYIQNEKNRTFYIEGRSEVDEIMEYFVFHKSCGEGSFQDFLYNSVNVLDKSTLVVITPILTEEQVNEIIGVGNMGYSLEIMYVNIDFKDLNLLRKLKENNIKVLSYEEAVEEGE